MMASYSEESPKADHYPSHPQHMIPQYPPLPDENSPNSAPFPPYPDTDPALQPVPLQPAPAPQQLQQQQQHQQASAPKSKKSHGQADGGESKDVKNRLRKACDSCSIRKVKCDEESPCKACVTLEIPCTFERPSKRRGPPNRHADAIKKQRTDAPGNAAHSQPVSPTHAAHTLASFSQQQILSAESIMPWPVLTALVDDYFTFIHPLIPLPHEPSFRQALQRREDVSNSTFLALLASMLGCLVASFPRRPRQHLRNLGFEGYFPNSMSVVDRCNKVAIEAQGPATFHRNYTVHDAIISYLQGLTSAYTFKRDPCLIYLNQCLSICTTMGLHKSSATGNTVDGFEPPRMTPNGQSLQGPQPHGGGDLVLQELGRRTFWVLFVTVKSLHQLGVSPFVLNVPPATKADPYPPLPLEVDDRDLTPQQIYPQPSGTVSQMVGFNINARVFSSYDQITTNELIHGVNEVFDWERQKAELEESLQKVKSILEELPSELQITTQPASSNEVDLQYPPSMYEETQAAQEYHTNGAFTHDGLNSRSTIQHEIQKANIYASQLGTRSYLVEKHWSLSASSHQQQATMPPRSTRQHLQQAQMQTSLASTSSSALTEAAMTAERLDIIQDFLRVLSSISQVSMEPNGGSFIQKVRAIASTLLTPPNDRVGAATAVAAATTTNHHAQKSGGGGSRGRPRKPRVVDDNADDEGNLLLTQPGGGGQASSTIPAAAESQAYLQRFLAILAQLEGVVPPSETPSEQDEDAQVRGWADFRGEQLRFARRGGFGG